MHHASEMFGFSREVYMYCAKGWGENNLINELDYVQKIFYFLSSNFPASITIFAKSSLNIMGSSNGRKGMITIDHYQDDAKDVSESDKMIGDECSGIKER
ncbi:hypothetical protein CQW23_14726 [Capsicum baccatum]|uniref:Uncharacterized protein n=1 Tax=Capsicum baccatum TaxID=33114 RepID=A0A2G2WK00_CAPBA|nr:hypothetical protein CQW23_14726 [Capsicum baccatum]